ncbi:MAG: hypothetical protein DWQ09_16060 [Proteobacteria bacterium]|nr:MAG: hypothetical protein DWQ09_16060 [Pseudomonadota bacterium]
MSINRFLRVTHLMRRMLIGVFALGVITLVAGIMQGESTLSQQAAVGGSAEHAAPGWGAEALNDDRGDHRVTFNIIRPANACGLGASSCFKCHNGNRAVAPGMDAESDRWHTDHRSVNNSCAGCHQGNPRLMKEALAHTNMLANPLTNLDQACASCHRNTDVNELAKAYQAKSGGK